MMRGARNSDTGPINRIISGLTEASDQVSSAASEELNAQAEELKAFEGELATLVGGHAVAPAPKGIFTRGSGHNVIVMIIYFFNQDAFNESWQKRQ
jgi:hypothetical protein